MSTFGFHSLIPTQTQFASCSETGLSTSTTSSSTSAPTSTHSGTVNATIVNPAQNRVAEESLETTTSDGITVVVSQYATTVDGTRTVVSKPFRGVGLFSPRSTDCDTYPNPATYL